VCDPSLSLRVFVSARLAATLLFQRIDGAEIKEESYEGGKNA
jgi:hypothetical protein